MYEITLDRIYTVYRRVFGFSSLLVDGFIQHTVPTQDGTLAIDAKGNFYYCPSWCEKWLTNPTRFNDGCMHEVMHPILGDMSREMSQAQNLASDAVINSTMFLLGLAKCELMQAFYSGTRTPECILRPYSKPPVRYQGLYRRLYDPCRTDDLNPLEVLQALEILEPDQKALKVPLLGGHGRKGSGAGTGDEEGSGSDEEPQDLGFPTVTLDGQKIDPKDFDLPSEVITDSAEGLEKYLKEMGKSGRGAGWNGSAYEQTMNVVAAKASLRSEVIKAFGCRDKINKLKRYLEGGGTYPSVVPRKIHRRDAYMVSIGVDPVFWQVDDEAEEEHRGLHVYIDVSGSVFSALPKMLGVLYALRSNIEKIYQFSNVVAPTRTVDLIKGEKAKLCTSGGTDFNCVIEHAVKNKVARCLVFTDGDAGASEKNKDLARKHIEKCGVVYFGAYQNKKNWLATNFGITFDLKELVQ